jgi:hypothetical protein
MAHDKRESARVDILGKLAGEVSVLAPIIIRDISRTGVLVECGFPLILESGHDLRLHLGDDSVVVKARVVRCHIADVGRELAKAAQVEFGGFRRRSAAARILRVSRGRVRQQG